VKTRIPVQASLTSEQFGQVAKALADPRRMALLEAIASRGECPCERLRRDFPVSKGTISHHIKELVRAGLIDAVRKGSTSTVKSVGKCLRHTRPSCCEE